MTQECFHRPGKTVRGIVTCRHCRVAIEFCPCVNETFRKVDDNCAACLGSMWVAIVRGRAEKFKEFVALAELSGVAEEGVFMACRGTVCPGRVGRGRVR